MPRSRMVKPEFWDDEKLATISRDARLTFIGMWTHSDDYGVVKGHPAWLKNKIYPYEEIKQTEFQKWLKELFSLHCIIPFNQDGEQYYYIRSFVKHQTINRPSSLRNPEPPDGLIEDSLNTHGVLIDETETEVKPKPKPKPKPVTASVTYSDDFLKWYEKYPNKVNRKKAFEAWGKVNRPSLEILLQKLNEQIQGKQEMEQGKMFVPDWPHPTTYLNGERWEDIFKVSGNKKPTDTEDYIGKALRGEI